MMGEGKMEWERNRVNQTEVYAPVSRSLSWVWVGVVRLEE